MVYFTEFDSAFDFTEAQRLIREVNMAVEEQRRAMELVAQFPTKEVAVVTEATRNVSYDFRPSLEFSQQTGEVMRVYHETVFPAVEAAKEVTQQLEQLQSVIREVQSAIEAVQVITPRQWSVLAAGAGVTLSVSGPLWASVSGMATPIDQPPIITLTDIAIVIAGEAGYAASVTLDIASYYLKSVFTDDANATIALYLVAGVIAVVINADPSLRDIERVVAWLPLLVAFIKKLLVDEEN